MVLLGSDSSVNTVFDTCNKSNAGKALLQIEAKISEFLHQTLQKYIKYLNSYLFRYSFKIKMALDSYSNKLLINSIHVLAFLSFSFSFPYPWLVG